MLWAIEHSMVMLMVEYLKTPLASLIRVFNLLKLPR